jgi:cyclopropane fatty-acyl-phospholipid synthase-like methyltransferase
MNSTAFSDLGGARSPRLLGNRAETATEAAVSLIELLADRLRLTSGLRVCDIGCGYGATARYLAEKHATDITGVTVSGAQAQIASLHQVTQGSVSIQLQDWLCNSFAAESFDRAYAVESSKHMPDKQRFFNEAFRTLRPNGLFVVCALLARDEPRPWEIRYLSNRYAVKDACQAWAVRQTIASSLNARGSACCRSRISVIR